MVVDVSSGPIAGGVAARGIASQFQIWLTKGICPMSSIVYRIVEHDGGWAYEVDGVFSETFPSHDQARAAARRAAGEQRVSDEDRGISYEDSEGRWHEEVAAGDDRPTTTVEG